MFDEFGYVKLLYIVIYGFYDFEYSGIVGLVIFDVVICWYLSGFVFLI